MRRAGSRHLLDRLRNAKAEGSERGLKSQAQVSSALASTEVGPKVRTKVRRVRTPYAQGDEVRTGQVRTDRD